MTAKTITRMEVGAMHWRYSECADCGEHVALLVDDGADRGVCMACYRGAFGYGPQYGEIVFKGAPDPMVDYWLAG